MSQAFEFIIDMLRSLILVLQQHTFNIWNINVTIADLLFAILITGFVIAVFWKGART